MYIYRERKTFKFICFFKICIKELDGKLHTMCAYWDEVCAVRSQGTMNESRLLVSLVTGCRVVQLALRWLGIISNNMLHDYIKKNSAGMGKNHWYKGFGLWKWLEHYNSTIFEQYYFCNAFRKPGPDCCCLYCVTIISILTLIYFYLELLGI